MSDLFPPFAPDPMEPRRRLFKPVPFRVIAPNVITLIALCLGLTAIRFAFEGRLEPAVLAILVAAALDGIDGRVARLLKGTSRFGAELDSLADFVNFGVTPALVLYSFVLFHLKALGWIVALLFAIAAAPLALVYLLAVGFLMISTIPTFSGKTVGKRVPRHWVLPLLILTVAFVALLVSFPFEVLAVGTILYLATIPFGVARYRQLDRAHAAPPHAATMPADQDNAPT
jgi:CDP-diacylglycerol---serine O-phosphatidyltransferase